jgi:serine/threonine-protein kinase RsbW
VLDQLRHQVTGWAARAGMAMGRVQDLVLAVYEAMANVAVHAYAGEPGLLDLRARHRGGRITVTVTDHGRRRPAPVPGMLHGRGLPLIRTLADEVSFSITPTGTTVELSWARSPGS